MSDINKEIENLSTKMEKSTVDYNEKLVETIKNLGPEKLKKAMVDLKEKDLKILKSVLENMKKGMESKIDIKKSENNGENIMKSKLIETINVMSAEDLKKAVENLTEPQAKVLKSVLEEMKKGRGPDKAPRKKKGSGVDHKQSEYFVNKFHQKVGNSIDKPDRDEWVRGASELSSETHEHIINKLDEHYEKDPFKKAASVPKKLENEPQAKPVKGELEDTIIQEDKADDDEDEKLVKDSNKDIKHQGDDSPEGKKGQVIKACGDPLLKEEDEVENKEKDPKKKKPVKGKKEEIVEKEIVDTPTKKMEKSIVYEKDEKSLLKACTLGRNFHFSVNEYEAQLAKAEEDSKKEPIKKSEEDSNKESDINDIIEKGEDLSIDESVQESLNKAHKPEFNLAKSSFEDSDLLAALGISEEEAKKIK